MKKIIVVIPTYNERENITLLVQKIFALNIPRLSVLIVDDSSPDGTAERAEKLGREYPLRIIRRPRKEGLGSAYAAVFREIADSEEHDYIIHMDADLSHDPKEIPRLIARAENHDVVVGSRYIKGGAIERWNLVRRLLSRFGNRYARGVLSLPYSDVTSGFRCFRREALEKLVREPFESIGYNFQIEMLYRAHRHGLEIAEIPITFTERKTGRSKIDIPIIVESFYKVLLLRFKGRVY